MEVHRCRFVKYTPAPVADMAFTPSSFPNTYFAAGRTDGTIEIWCPRNRWTLLKTIAGGDDQSIESLTWAYSAPEKEGEEEGTTTSSALRLFSAGLNAKLTEWDFTTLEPKSHCDSYGGAVWCVKANPSGTLLAAACDDGCIRLYDIADGAFTYLRSFDKTKLRILSLDWSPSGQTLITGSADSNVRKWDVSTGRVLEKMSVGRTASHRTMVWTVAYVKDVGYVSGDSAGRVILWDDKTHTALETFQKHKADVLALAVSPDGKTIFSTGVDRTIVRYTRTGVDLTPQSRGTHGHGGGEEEEEEEEVSFVVSGMDRSHQHDVRALAMCTRPEIDALATGGMDVQIRVGSVKAFDREVMHPKVHNSTTSPKSSPSRLLPLAPKSPLANLVPARHWLLARSTHSVDLWALEPEVPFMPEGVKRQRASETPEASAPKYSALSKAASSSSASNRLLLHVQLQGSRHLTASAISEDGNWLAIADPHLVRLFRVVQSDKGQGSVETVSLRKQKSFPALAGITSSSGVPQYLLLTPDSTKLIVGSAGGQVTVVDLSQWENGSFRILASWKLDEARGDASANPDMLRGIGGMRVSGDGAWLAVADLGHHVYLYSLDALKRHAILALARSRGPVTAMLFKPDSSSLYVVQAGGDGRVSEYDVEKRAETSWSKRASSLPLPPHYVNTRDAVLGMSMDPDRMDRLLLWGQATLCQVILDADALPLTEAKTVDGPIEGGSSSHRRRSGKRKKTSETSETSKAVSTPSGISGNYATIHKYGPMLFMGHIGPGKGVVVERSRWSLLEGAPPAFYTKKFGR